MRLRHLLAGLILALASGLRLAALDWPPLTPEEAQPALAAIAGTPVASPYPVDAAEQTPVSPAYASLTRPVMVSFGPQTWGARAIPAMAGVALVALPLTLVGFLGWPTALAAMALLAFSPSLVTVSRTAGGGSLALLGVAGVLAGIARRGISRSGNVQVGISLAIGLALASGPPVWMGLVGLALAVAFQRGRGAGRILPGLRPDPRMLRTRAVLAAVFLVALSTAFFTDVSLFSGVLAGPASWLRGWSLFTFEPALRTSPMLISAELLLLGLGVGVFVAERRTWGPAWRVTATWSIVALALFVAYPGRAPGDLVWAVLPLAFLGGRGLVRVIGEIVRSENWAIVAAMSSGLLAAAFFGLFLFQRNAASWLTLEPLLRVGLFASVGAVIVGVILIVWWSWGTRTALRGLALSGLSLLALWNLGSLYTANFAARAADANTLWRGQTTPASALLAVNTLEDLSHTATGRTDALVVDVQGERTAQLAWLLRAFRPPGPDDLTGRSAPVILVREGQPLPKTGSDYIGQDLVLSERRGFSAGLRDSLRALAGRPAPSIPVRWTIYVRADLVGLPKLGEEPAE